MDKIEVLSSNVKKYRTSLGLSQEQFAEKCGLHRTYISSIERFQYSNESLAKNLLDTNKKYLQSLLNRMGLKEEL